MSLASFPFSCKMFSNSHDPMICVTRTTTNSHIPCLKFLKTNHKNFPKKTSSYGGGLTLNNQVGFSSSRKHMGLSIAAALGGSKSSTSGSSGEADHRALETVLKLYTAIKNRNITELSDTIGEECRGVSNFISKFQPFQGKQQALDFFSLLMRTLGNHMEFVVQPTMYDGMNVGVSWRLEWNNTQVPLGKGFSFYTCHVYHGKVMINNVEMFMVPLLHIEPLRLRMMGFVMTVLDKIGYNAFFKGKDKRATLIYLLLALSLVTALLCFTWSTA